MNVLSEALRKDSLEQTLRNLFYLPLLSNDHEVRVGIHPRDQGRSPEFVVEEMFSFESDIGWEYEFFFILCKDHSYFLLQQSYTTLIDEVG